MHSQCSAVIQDGRETRVNVRAVVLLEAFACKIVHKFCSEVDLDSISRTLPTFLMSKQNGGKKHDTYWLTFAMQRP